MFPERNTLAPMFVTRSKKAKKTFHIAHILNTGMWKMNLQEQIRVRISGHNSDKKQKVITFGTK